jgi:hypothetical protein
VSVPAAEARAADGRQSPLPPERERALVEAAQRGDATARAALVEAYMPRVAQRLRASLQWGGSGGVTCGLLEIAGDERLRELAERLQAMLEGARPTVPVR